MKRKKTLWYRQPPRGLRPLDHMLSYDTNVWAGFYFACSGRNWGDDVDPSKVDEAWFYTWILMKRYFRQNGKPEYARFVDVILAAKPLPDGRPNVG